MVFKAVKYTVVGGVAALALGGLVFGTSLGSYLTTSAGAVSEAVKESVPVEFELRRARDLLDEIIPEMQANIRLIAQEEVEIDSLQESIAESEGRLDEQSRHIAGLRAMLETQQVAYNVRGISYDRADIREELSHQLASTKEAQVVLASKEHILESRRKSLASAEEMLHRTRSTKALLEDRIESLAAQHRMVQAASVGSAIALDQSKLTQTKRLLDEIDKRLEVAERVLAHETRFTRPMPMIQTVDEAELLTEVDAFLAGRDKLPAETDPSHGLSHRDAN